MLFDLARPDLALRLTVVVACLGLSLELLELVARPRFLSEAGPVPWSIVALQHRWTATGSASRVMTRLFIRPPRTWLVPAAALTIGLGACALVPGAPLLIVQFGALGIGTTLVLLAMRSFYGLDGAFHMVLVVFVTIGVTVVLPAEVGGRMAVYFIAATAVLAYFISGASKIVSPIWRSGAALPGILGTRAYGNAFAHRVVDRFRPLAVASCWAVMLLEIGFPLGFAIGGDTLAGFLLAGAVFHLAVALTMGLNGFFFAFVSTYPCVWFTAEALHSSLF